MLSRSRFVAKRCTSLVVLRSAATSSAAQGNGGRVQLRQHRGKLAFAALFAGSAVGAYIWNKNGRQIQCTGNLGAALRILNLTSTVMSIAFDYAFAISTRTSDTAYDEQLAVLHTAQVDLEDAFAKMHQATTLEDQRHWEIQVRDARQRVDNAAEELGRMDANHAGGWLHDVHLRSAGKLRDMCAQNRGVYIKLGQHLAQLDYLIPLEYCDTLRSLLDNTPVSSFESVQRIIKEEFGLPIEELFVHFEPTPLASASLAQVHAAVDKQGRKCAVKVQHEGLREGSTADRAAITFLVNQLERCFSQFRYSWLTREMNINTPLELDFTNEAQNAKRCTQLLERYCGDDVVVPTIHASSSRVLIMSWEDGFYVTEREKLRAANLAPEKVSRLISKAFCSQIYREGFVHCDPHEANLLVREHPKKKAQPQLVLLDHGLYRELDDTFRVDYCRLWHALILSDEKKIEYYCRKMGVGEMFPLLASMLTMRPWDDITSSNLDKIQVKGTDSENAMLRAYAHKYFKHIGDVLADVKPELLLLFKTNDCLRHLDRALGTPYNNSLMIATTCNDMILEESLKEAKSIGATVQAYINYLQLYYRAGLFWASTWTKG